MVDGLEADVVPPEGGDGELTCPGPASGSVVEPPDVGPGMNVKVDDNANVGDVEDADLTQLWFPWSKTAYALDTTLPSAWSVSWNAIVSTSVMFAVQVNEVPVILG